MDHRRPALREPAPFALARVNGVGQAGPRAEEAHRVEVGDVLEPRALEDQVALGQALARVRVDGQPLLLREPRRPSQEFVRAGHGETGLHGDPQPTPLAAVPIGQQARGLGEALRRRSAQLFRRRPGVVHQHVAARVADPGPRRRPEEGVGVAHGPHVEHRRDAGSEALREPEARRDRERVRVVRRLARPDVRGQPGQEFQVLRAVAQQRLAQVEVGLNESRQDPFAPRVEALDRLAPPSGGRAGLVAARRDRAVLRVEVGRGPDVAPVLEADEGAPLEKQSAHARRLCGPARLSRTAGGSSPAFGRRQTARPRRALRGRWRAGRRSRPPPNFPVRRGNPSAGACRTRRPSDCWPP